MLHSLLIGFRNLSNQPGKVLTLAIAFAIASVVLDGTALRLWSLHREHQAINVRINDAKTRTSQLAYKIIEAQSTQFIERAARDQFDFVKEGDLVFVFPDEIGPEVSDNSANL